MSSQVRELDEADARIVKLSKALRECVKTMLVIKRVLMASDEENEHPTVMSALKLLRKTSEQAEKLLAGAHAEEKE